MATVEVDIDLSDLDDSELLEELQSRKIDPNNPDLNHAAALFFRKDKDCLIYLERYLNGLNHNHDFDGLAELFGVK